MKTLKNATMEELQVELQKRILEQEEAKKNAQEVRALKIQTVKSYEVDLIAPQHGRTSCDDKNLANGLQSLPPRCARCALLQVAGGVAWPRNYDLRVVIEEA